MEATHDYQAAQCADFTNSSVDRVISHATYGGGWHDRPPATGPGGNKWTLKKMSQVTENDELCIKNDEFCIISMMNFPLLNGWYRWGHR